MKRIFQALLIMLGQSPSKPSVISEAAQRIYQEKQQQPKDIAALKEELTRIRQGQYSKKWRQRRWITLILINLCFTLSFWLDLQLFEGSLIASRVFGFHMADPYSAMQVVLGFGLLSINLAIGTVTVIIFWSLLGGRGFCSWVCPYHLLAEWAEIIHLKLVEKKSVTDHPFHRSSRLFFWLFFLITTLLFNYGLFMTINPVGIVSRALIYGVGLSILFVVFLLLIEIFYSRRAWCRYVCPMGLTYGLLGSVSPIKLTYHLPNCQHEGTCLKVCEVPHVLECIKKGKASDVKVPIGMDCTLCGACVDICPTQSLRFEIKGFTKSS